MVPVHSILFSLDREDRWWDTQAGIQQGVGVCGMNERQSWPQAPSPPWTRFTHCHCRLQNFQAGQQEQMVGNRDKGVSF